MVKPETTACKQTDLYSCRLLKSSIECISGSLAPCGDPVNRNAQRLFGGNQTRCRELAAINATLNFMLQPNNFADKNVALLPSGGRISGGERRKYSLRFAMQTLARNGKFTDTAFR